MSLAGGDHESARRKIADAMKETYPNDSDNYYVTCDTEGALATACENGNSQYCTKHLMALILFSHIKFLSLTTFR